MLHGLLSPVDGIGPSALGLDSLEQRLQSPELRPQRLLVQLEDSVEGRTTGYYLQTMAQRAGIEFESQPAAGIAP